LLSPQHFILNGNPIKAPFPNGIEVAVFGNGCYWGTEKGKWCAILIFSYARQSIQLICLDAKNRILALAWCLLYCGRLLRWIH
jgi:hypothetical protein